MAGKLFYFTLGPVQGFVAQARRTRDFWAGSFLLSWLSGVAMAEILRQGGQVTFPQPATGYLDWIVGQGQGEPPRQGAIPNRFKAVAARVPQTFDGALLAQTVREAWWKLAEHVWQMDQLAQFDVRGQTHQIWERQNRHFWDISWAVSDDELATDLLDRRKNWRSHASLSEPGVKCMVMDGWQELSGAERPGLSSRDGQPTLLARFWRSLRESGVTGMATDLREQEHLCALAYVKRRFARHFDSLDVTLSSGLRVRGWALESGMPSVAYMAAAHWLQALVEHLPPEELNDVYQLAKSVSDSHGEWQSRIRCLVETAERKAPHIRRLLALDGNLFFDHVLHNPRAYGYDVAATETLRKKLASVRQRYPVLDAIPLSPYYAILLMDGDALGCQMSEPAKQLPISAALNAFTQAVPHMVYQHNGQLIYAGGDDVLAILPLEDALTCAAAVRGLYAQCFRDHAPSVATSISAAVAYAHIKIPLNQVLTDAHDLLDAVAKNGTGRDAIATRVWNTGGMALQWSQPWDIALHPDGTVALNHLVADLRGLLNADAIFTSKFFFRIRELFALLNPQEGQKAVLSEEQAIDMLAVEFWHSAENRQWPLTEARQRIAPLLAQCRPVKRSAAQPPQSWARSEQLQADGALLVRFLANKGVD